MSIIDPTGKGTRRAREWQDCLPWPTLTQTVKEKETAVDGKIEGDKMKPIFETFKIRQGPTWVKITGMKRSIRGKLYPARYVHFEKPITPEKMKAALEDLNTPDNPA